MKRKNAFAFRDFDATRILQRAYFKSLNLPNLPDAEILESLSRADEVEAMESNLTKLEEIHRRLGKYRLLIERHCQRGARFNRQQISTYGETGAATRRHVSIGEYFFCKIDVIELREKIERKFQTLNKAIEEKYKSGILKRLRDARKAAGLTQKELGEKVYLSPQVMNRYEIGHHDIPIATLIRLAKALNMNGNQILEIE